MMRVPRQTEVRGERRGTRVLDECGGACGDLGTLLPYLIGAITIAGLAPAGLLLGFGVFLVGSGLFYGLPIAVQPMKAVGAVMLTSGLSPGEVAAAGIMLGLILLALGASGAIGWLARLIPRSVTAGLQLGLGLSMAALGLSVMAEAAWLGVMVLFVLLLLQRIPGCPAAPLALGVAIAAGWLAGMVSAPAGMSPGLTMPALALPAWSDLPRAIELAVLPQIPLTITNAVIVTAALAQALFPGATGRASERNLALTSGLANLALAPFGAMPMCHGAGGLQAQYRFGGRSGAAPVLLGMVLLVLGLWFASEAVALLALIPLAAVGALLVVSGGDLAFSRRLFDARPVCWPVIGVTAALTLAVNPAAGLVCGWLLEVVRRPLAQALSGLLRRP
jgi:MFS superfamily sulfate permease-like transporter